MKPLLPIVLLAFAPGLAGATTLPDAEACTEIATVPAVIARPGVYCLAGNLATSMASGAAITIGGNHVTLDCHGRLLDGRGGGPESKAVGISAVDRSKVTVRDCSVRGFRIGIRVADDAAQPGLAFGAVVEGNQVDRSSERGIVVSTDASLVRGNSVVATGREDGAGSAIGIQTTHAVDVIDNTVQVVLGGLSAVPSTGILSNKNEGGAIAGNRVADMRPLATAIGIDVARSHRVVVRDNFVASPGGMAALGIRCSAGDSIARDNVTAGYATGATGCFDGGGNVSVGAGVE